ncbi:MAG: type II toxin-antitoxin system Phd/YefM family antitoxin [Nitrospirota bacterium]
MKTLPLSEVKTSLSKIVEAVSATDEEVVITRNGRPAAILVSPDEFESWKETTTIQANPAFMAEIRRGLRTLKSKKARLYTLDELIRS